MNAVLRDIDEMWSIDCMTKILGIKEVRTLYKKAFQSDSKEKKYLRIFQFCFSQLDSNVSRANIAIKVAEAGLKTPEEILKFLNDLFNDLEDLLEKEGKNIKFIQKKSVSDKTDINIFKLARFAQVQIFCYSLKQEYSYYIKDSRHRLGKKIKTSLSVTQLAIFFELLQEKGIIKGETKTDLEKFVVEHFTSKKEDAVSQHSLHNKLTEANFGDWKILRNLFMELHDEAKRRQ